MTIILLTTFFTVIVAWFFYKQIHKYKYFLYATSLLIALVAAEEGNLINLGYVPFGIFLVVMFSGALDKGILRKRLFMVRAELAVIASILIAPHSLGYLEYFLDEIGILNGDLSFYVGVVSFFVIIPLFVTSFTFVRKHMNYKQWKNLHKLSYVFYLFIGFHLILIQNDRMILYIVLFGTYVLLKTSMFILKRK